MEMLRKASHPDHLSPPLAFSGNADEKSDSTTVDVVILVKSQDNFFYSTFADLIVRVLDQLAGGGGNVTNHFDDADHSTVLDLDFEVVYHKCGPPDRSKMQISFRESTVNGEKCKVKGKR